MSELGIGLVAEGPTDHIVIQAVLKAFLPQPFRLTLLQPEPTRPKAGTGWGGVLKWCREFQQFGYTHLSQDPRLSLFDVVIIHLDADVADEAYADCGQDVEQLAIQQGLAALPCALPCPPSSTTVENVENLLLSWLGISGLGANALFCIPSKSSEAWLGAAVLSGHPELLQTIECEMNIEGILATLPKGQRIRKSQREYRDHANIISAHWSDRIQVHCPQAGVFETRVLAALPVSQ